MAMQQRCYNDHKPKCYSCPDIGLCGHENLKHVVCACNRHFGQTGVCRGFAGGSAGVGNSTKAPSTGDEQRGESAASQHDEDYMSNLKETQGKAGRHSPY